MHTDFQYILLQREGAVLRIVWNRPEKLNAFHDRMLDECVEAVEIAAKDDSVRCVVLAGAGRAFGAGQDLAAFVTKQIQADDEVQQHLAKYHRIVTVLQEMPKPVIAVLHGVATGISLNLALACDLRIAAENVRISEAFARIGLIPDGGGAYFLTRLVGLSKALELALLAEEISGVEAERIGLVNKCVPLDQLEDAVRSLAQHLAQGPTSSYASIKKLFYASLATDLPGSLALEGRLQAQALQTADHREGIAAFIEKRPATYPGK